MMNITVHYLTSHFVTKFKIYLAHLLHVNLISGRPTGHHSPSDLGGMQYAYHI